MAIRRFSIGVVLALVLLAIIIGVSSNARAAAVCTPTSTVSGAYARNGAGDVCFQTTNLCSYINSWNLSALEVNGTDYTNQWVDSRSIAPLNGAYIVHYVGSFAWSHFEIAGTCGSTTPPPTTPPVTTPPATTPPATTPPATTPPVTTPPPGSVSINSGGPATGGFSADQYFSGGSTYTNTRTIDMSYIPANMVPAAIFSTERYGTMTYTIPNRSGTQTVTLYFAETYVTAAGQRVFNVVVNGQTVLSNYDIFARAGAADRAIYHRFVTTANSSGQVVIQFTAVTQSPKINGITVVAGGTITPPPTTPPATTPPVTTPPVTTPPPTTPPPTTPPPGSFLDNLDNYNTNLFQKADGWTNGDPFNVGWRADHVNFAGGIMTMTLDNQTCPSGCSNRPYASGEYRRNALTGYGRYEARFKAAKGNGIVGGTLFTYTGPSDNQPWDEIDIEILGKDTTRMQTNYFTNGTGGHESVINLGFDASAGFHTYAFEWTASSIRWYVDGALVHTENGSRGALPTHQSKLMMNMWPGIGVDSWLGSFTYTGPLQFQVDWIRYTPMQ